jgi:NodT family efflux transporter outer membrane factor (OMF) lipoprotein
VQVNNGSKIFYLLVVYSLARIKYRSCRFKAALFAGLLCSACSTPPQQSEMPLEPPPRFTQAGGDQAAPDRWWQSFDDPHLTSLMERALNRNFTLRAAWARLRQAEAAARREGASLWPTLDAQGSVTRQDSDTAEPVTTRQVALAAAYEIDLWGRLRATSDAAALDAEASAADLRVAAISLSAELADTWYQLLEQRAQVALVKSQIETNRQLLKLVEARFRIGQTNASDIYRQRQLLAQTEGQLAQAESGLDRLQHQLAILLGTPPGNPALPTGARLPALGPLPATGVPAELLQRRPDLQAARLRLGAADARTAAAVAARYPRLDLSAALSTSSGSGELFSNWLGNLVAQLSAPLFDGGQRRAEALRARAAALTALNEYGQALLEALGEVEGALTAEQGQRRYLASLEAQLQQAEAVLRQERQRYFQGDSDYLSVLDALRSRQTLERQRVTARRQLISERISLVRALAGGWSMTPPEDLNHDR